MRERELFYNRWLIFNEAGFAVRERNRVVSLSGACLDGVTHKGKRVHIQRNQKLTDTKREREREKNLPIVIIFTCMP